MKTYIAKSGKKQYKQSIKVLEEVILADNTRGFCLCCGEEQDGVEPDGRRYRCVNCGQSKVYGAEQLVLMGLCY